MSRSHVQFDHKSAVVHPYVEYDLHVGPDVWRVGFVVERSEDGTTTTRPVDLHRLKPSSDQTSTSKDS